MIQVMLADDQAMVRGALAALLTLETDIEVVAQVGNGNDVLPSRSSTGPTSSSWTLTCPVPTG